MKRIWLAILVVLALASSTWAQSPSITRPLSSITCPGAGCLTLSVSGLGAASIQATGTFVGTLTFEATSDGSTYAALTMTPSGGGSGTTTATAPGLWQGAIGGIAIVRVRFSAYTSGTATVTIQASQNGTNLLTQSNTWAGTQTFDDAVCTGTCTGFNGGNAPDTATFLTATDQTSTLTGSRHLIAGTNITFDDTTPGQRTVSASGGGGGTPGGAPTSVQFNNSGSFGGFGTWDGYSLRINDGTQSDGNIEINEGGAVSSSIKNQSETGANFDGYNFASDKSFTLIVRDDGTTRFIADADLDLRPVGSLRIGGTAGVTTTGFTKGLLTDAASLFTVPSGWTWSTTTLTAPATGKIIAAGGALISVPAPGGANQYIVAKFNNAATQMLTRESATDFAVGDYDGGATGFVYLADTYAILQAPDYATGITANAAGNLELKAPSGNLTIDSTPSVTTTGFTKGILTGTDVALASVSGSVFIATATSPAVANIGANSCGTTAAFIAGPDNAPVITTGSVAWTACRITFDTTAPNGWNCSFSNGSTHTLAATPYQSGSSTTTADISASSLGVASDVLTGICLAR